MNIWFNLQIRNLKPREDKVWFVVLNATYMLMQPEFRNQDKQRSNFQILTIYIEISAELQLN